MFLDLVGQRLGQRIKRSDLAIGGEQHGLALVAKRLLEGVAQRLLDRVGQHGAAQVPDPGVIGWRGRGAITADLQDVIAQEVEGVEHVVEHRQVLLEVVRAASASSGRAPWAVALRRARIALSGSSFDWPRWSTGRSSTFLPSASSAWLRPGKNAAMPTFGRCLRRE